MTSKQSQVGGEAVETQPSKRRQNQAVAHDLSPFRVNPGSRVLGFGLSDRKPVGRAKAEVNGLGNAVLPGQHFLALARIRSLFEAACPVDVRADVPPPSPFVDRGGTWADAAVRDASPIRKVVSGAMARLREVRHLVVFKPG